MTDRKINEPLDGRLVACGLIAMVLLTYAPAMFAGFIWDDDQYVTDNTCLRAPAGLKRIWLDPTSTPQYYPMVFTTFWVEFQLWELRAPGYHVVNVIFHALGAVLLFRVLTALRVPGAAFAAALFAVHPVHVESVAWITERKNVLSGFFYLLAFLAYWRFSVPKGVSDSSRRWWYYALALGLFVCALLSKSVTCTLPAAILLVRWWKFGRVTFRDVVLLSPMFVIGVVAGLNTAVLESHRVGATGSEWNWTLLERCLIAGRAVWFYATKLVWPQPLSFVYPKWHINAMLWWQYVFPLSALAVTGALWFYRRRLGRGPLVAVLLFGGSLFPALGFVNVYPMRFSFVADHFQYLASIGLITLAAAGAAAMCERFRVSRPRMTFLAATVLLTMGLLSFFRCFAYGDEEVLWVDTLNKHPACVMANTNLGCLRLRQGRVEEAAALLLTALSYSPDDRTARRALGDLEQQRGRIEQANQHYRRALKYYRRELRSYPRQAAIHNNMGILLGKLGQHDEAIEHFNLVLEIDPENVSCHRNLGELLYGLRRFDESWNCFHTALELDPLDPQNHYNLGVLSLQLGDRDLAVKHLREALRIDPDFRQAKRVLRQALGG